MGYLALALLVFGILFLVVEILIPGLGVFGIMGLLAVLSAAAVTIFSVENGIMIVVAGLVIILVIGYFLIDFIKKKNMYGNLILKETLKEDREKINKWEELMDKHGVVKTPLKPHGKVDFDGVVAEAYSDGDFIDVGQQVIAYKVYANNLYVKKI